MKRSEKKTLIRKLYAEGKIKKLGNGCYSVPSEFFVHGITPRFVNEVLGKEK
jgi:hypothetical protein